MLTVVKILTRCRPNHQNPSSLSSIISSRFLTFTTRKEARYQRGLRDLKKAVNKKIEAKKNYKQEDAALRRPEHLGKAFAFVAGTAFATYSCSTIIEYQKEKRKMQKWMEETIAEFKRIYFGQPVQRGIDKTVATLIGLNLAVFLLWRIPALQPFMLKYFTSSFASKNLCLPMLLGTFSHNYFFHLFMNMYVLTSFATGSIAFMGREQFFAFYLTSGVFASFVSLVEKCVTRSLLPSLGASGAIAAMLGYVCSKMPDSQISIVFLPQWTFSAQNGLYGIIAFEVALLLTGLLMPKIKLFDNAAHLGGLLFGIWYAHYGEFAYRQWFQPKIVHLWLQSGFAPKNQTPVIVYDGKRHIHTTMDKMENGTFEEDKEAEEQKKREFEQKKRRFLFKKYQERKLQKEKERKEKILAERRRREEERNEEDDEGEE